MSQIKVQQPVVHTPTFRKWRVPRHYVDQIISQLGLEPLYPAGVHEWYWYTDDEGCGKLLPHLIQKSTLYKRYAFTCINYAFRVWNLAGELYGLNTWVPVIGKIPGYEARHAWLLVMRGDEKGLKKAEFTYFEPNDGFPMGEVLELAYQSFPIGKEGYTGEFILY